MTRTYTAFARQYPEYASSLFDQTFLAGPGAPELAKLLTRHLHPDPALFTQAWANSIGLSRNSNFRTEAIRPSSHFLQWLEEELKSEVVFQPLFDSRALENLSQLENQIEKLTAELKQEFHTALKAAENYEKMILGIVGDVNHSNIILGNGSQISVSNVYNFYYTGTFATINDFYIPPDAVFQRVRADEFIGRDWLTAKVDAFLNNPNQKSGMFLLLGDAGVGKTSFMAHLVKERRYLHLFAEQVPGDANVQRALQSLASQLITRYQITPYKDHNTLTQLAVFPDFIDKLLRYAVNTLVQGEKIVIVCDALDEAGTVPGGNVFGLPNILPDNVYLILSQRHVFTKLPNINTRTEKLEAQSGENLQDMEEYLNVITKQPEISGQIRSKNYSDEFFVQTLKEKSLGVWMYLHYITDEIRRGLRAPLELENLPTGLVGYYADYWSKWRYSKNGHDERQQKWDELYAPLLTTLAIAQEPITLEQLFTWAGINVNKYGVLHLLQEEWRSFLAVRESQGQTLYSPYHASFRDFLTGKVDTSHLRPAESYLIQNLAEQSQEAHKRIVNIFHRQCGGNWHELVEQDYPRLYLTAHLVGAGEFEALVDLLTEGGPKIQWAESRHFKEETYAGYRSDLEYVWKYAEQKKDLALHIRCMLIENSLHSLATNISADLLVELAKSEMWSYPRCLRIINQMSKSYQQAEAIKKISQYLPSSLYREALSVAEEIQDSQAQAEAITALLPYMEEDLRLHSLEKAVLSINKIDDQYIRLSKFIGLLPHLNVDGRSQALQSVLDALPKIDVETRARVVVELVPHLDEKLKSQVTQNVLDVLSQIKEEARSHVISLIPHLSEEIKPQVLQKTLNLVKGIIDDSKNISALINLIPHLNNDFQSQLLNIIRGLGSERELGEALKTLIPYLNDEHKISAVTIAEQVEDAEVRVNIFIKLIPYLNNQFKPKVVQQALAGAEDIEEEYERAVALASLLPYINENLRSKVLQDVIAIAQDLAREDRKVYFLDDYLEGILVKLVPHLSDELKLQAIALADNIKMASTRTIVYIEAASYLSDEHKNIVLATINNYENEEQRAEALADFFPLLKEDIKPQVLQKTLSMIQGFESNYDRSFALIKFLPYISNDLKTETVKGILVDIKEIKEEIRDIALNNLIPHVSNGLKYEVLQEVLIIKKKIKDEKDRAQALSNLIGYLNEDIKLEVEQEVLLTIQNIQDEYPRSQALINFAPYLNHRLESQAFTIAKEIKWEEERVETLMSILPYLSDDRKLQAQLEALAAAQEAEPETIRNRLLIQLLPNLNDDLRLQALDSALKTLEEFDVTEFDATGFRKEDYADMFANLIPYLNNMFVDHAWRIAEATSDDNARYKAILALTAYADKNRKSHALRIAQEIGEDYYRAIMLIDLLPDLSDDLRITTLQEALNTTQKIEDEITRFQVLKKLIPYLADSHKTELTEEMLLAIKAANNEYFRSDALVALIPYLDKASLPQALTFLDQFNEEHNRVKVLEALIPFLSNDLIPQALDLYKKIKNYNDRVRVLPILMFRLSHDQKHWVLASELEISNVYHRAVMLSALLPHLSGNLKQLALPKALESAQQIPWGEYRSNVLSTLLPYVNDNQKTLVLQGILGAIEEIEDEEKRVAEFVKQSSLFPEATMTRILGEALLGISVERAETILDEWKKLGFVGIEKTIFAFLRKVAQAERTGGLSILSKLLPAFIHFDGGKSYAEVLRSVKDTARWWP